MCAKKVIFIDTVHPVLADRLTSLGYVCEWHTDKSQEEILALLPQYAGMVIRSRFKVNQDVLNCATSLEFICRSGSGMENIDTGYAESKGVTCFNSPEGNRDAVGEHALGMLLSLFNNLNSGDLSIRNGEWEREANRGVEVKGKTIGIIGYGNMGKSFAQRLAGFECTVLAHDKYLVDYSDNYANESSLEEIFEKADVLSIHLPLTEETNNYISAEFINSFDKNIYLINTSRGKQLSLVDLLAGLGTGKVLGACLDVLEIESDSFEQTQLNPVVASLFKHNNVILSPHVAGWTQESYLKLSTVLADKVEREIGSA